MLCMLATVGSDDVCVRPEEGESVQTYGDRQTMVCLSFLSYLGFAEVSAGRAGDRHVARQLDQALRELPGLGGEWEIAWGPASHRFPLTIFAQNLVFVARRKDGSELALVIRGTNPVSPANWLVEDFSVMRRAPWPYWNGEGAIPKVSLGTLIGLSVIQGLRPGKALPGEGQSLCAWLGAAVRTRGDRGVRVTVVGHSLGGALAPAVALWLHDTRTIADHPREQPWDPQGRATLRVMAFGGPSPGDRAFSDYYDARLGEATTRGWNPLDVVPHGWEVDRLAKLDELYAPEVEADWLMRAVFWLTVAMAQRGDYRHVRPDALPIEGARLEKRLPLYEAQMLYQHSLAYLELEGLLGHLSIAPHLPFETRMQERIRGLEHEAAALHDGSVRVGPRTGALRRRLGDLSRALTRVVHVPVSVAVHSLPALATVPELARRAAHHRRHRETTPS